ncbi:MAG: M23 family metallopeptidase, partial [Alkalibacterium sp.]|nr:M23 family metallopeptidase [Alkalibacterium sp.]
AERRANEEQKQEEQEQQQAATSTSERREEESRQAAADRRAEEERQEAAAAQQRREDEQRQQAAAERRAEEERQQAAAQQRREEEQRQQAEAQRREEARRQAEEQARKDREEQEKQASAPSNSSPSQSSGWVRPASGRLTSGFGYRTHPVHGGRRMHSGIDIAGSGPIIATRAGTVTTATYHHSLGYYVVVDHGSGYRSLYAHMTPNLSVSRGQQVSQGQQLGIMGTTGTSTGVHLHFEIHKNGRPVNPAPYVGM